MSIKNYLIVLSIIYASANCYCMENNIKKNEITEITNDNKSEFVTINNDAPPKPQEQYASLQNYDINYYKNENSNLKTKIESLTQDIAKININYHNALKEYNNIMEKSIEQNTKINLLSKTIEEMKNNNSEVIKHNNLQEFLNEDTSSIFKVNDNIENKYRPQDQYMQSKMHSVSNKKFIDVNKVIDGNNLLIRLNHKIKMYQQQYEDMKERYHSISSLCTDFIDSVNSDIKYFEDQKRYLNKLLENLECCNLTVKENNQMLEYKGKIIEYINYLDPILLNLSEFQKIPASLKLDHDISEIKENLDIIDEKIHKISYNINNHGCYGKMNKVYNVLRTNRQKTNSINCTIHGIQQILYNSNYYLENNK